LNAFREAGFDISSVNLILVNSDYGLKLEMEEAHKILTNELEEILRAGHFSDGENL